MTVNESNADFLIVAIESVNKQLHPHWELCIANVTSTNGSTAAILQKFKSENDRIKIIPCSQKEDRSQAANSALELASGEFVAFLDTDDLLTEDALFWVTEARDEIRIPQKLVQRGEVSARLRLELRGGAAPRVQDLHAEPAALEREVPSDASRADHAQGPARDVGAQHELGLPAFFCQNLL